MEKAIDPYEAIFVPEGVDGTHIHEIDAHLKSGDAKAEGMESIAAFIKTWDAIYGAKGKGWEVNPWVLCTKFHVVREKE